jgi:hypothetical protein
VPKYLIYSPKLLYTYISFNLNNGSFIEVNFLFWNCHIKALDNKDLVLIIFDWHDGLSTIIRVGTGWAMELPALLSLVHILPVGGSTVFHPNYKWNINVLCNSSTKQ